MQSDDKKIHIKQLEKEIKKKVAEKLALFRQNNPTVSVSKLMFKAILEEVVVGLIVESLKDVDDVDLKMAVLLTVLDLSNMKKN